MDWNEGVFGGEKEEQGLPVRRMFARRVACLQQEETFAGSLMARVREQGLWSKGGRDWGRGGEGFYKIAKKRGQSRGQAGKIEICGPRCW